MLREDRLLNEQWSACFLAEALLTRDTRDFVIN